MPDQPVLQSISGDNTFDSGLKAGEDPVLLNNDLITTGSVTNILTISDFAQVRETPGDAFKLAVDLTFDSSVLWAPIGDLNNPFTGSFDGQNFTISGLYSSSRADYNGLFGYTNGATLENINLENVNIDGGRYVGGLVGRAENTTIANCSVTGVVTGNGEAVGGLVGYANSSSIVASSTDCIVSGFGKETQVGGLVGGMYIKNSVTDSFSSGSVDGSFNVGGLVGRMRGDNDIINCYSNTVVNESGKVIGGLVGISLNSTNICLNSFWDIELSGQTGSALGEGRTTEEMKAQATYTGWDFDAIWSIDEGLSYPILKKQYQPEEPVIPPGPDPEEPVLPPTPDPGPPAEKPAQTFEGFSPDYTGFLGSNYILVYRYLEEAERIIALLQADPEKITTLNLDLIRGSFNKAKLLFSQYHDYYNETERKSILERLRLINQNIIDFEKGL